MKFIATVCDICNPESSIAKLRPMTVGRVTCTVRQLSHCNEIVRVSYFHEKNKIKNSNDFGSPKRESAVSGGRLPGKTLTIANCGSFRPEFRDLSLLNRSPAPQLQWRAPARPTHDFCTHYSPLIPTFNSSMEYFLKKKKNYFLICSEKNSPEQ